VWQTLGKPGIYNTRVLPASARQTASRLESWFFQHQRSLPWRRTYDPYQVWVSEVMLQQTRMEVVLRYFDRFIAQFPSVTALADASEESVLAAWSGLGYYRRAKMLAAGAREVAEKFAGVVPSDIPALQSIPGVGRYTAGAIASIAFNQRAPIVDGNVARVLSRLFAITTIAGAWREAEHLVAASSDARAFNQGLMELGALVCTPTQPKCGECPLKRSCVAFATDRVDELPPAKPKRVARKLVVPLYLIGDGRGRLLMRRETGALMNAMFHLPHGSTELLPGRLLRVRGKELLGRFRHTITTRNVEFTVHRATLARSIADSGEYTWIHPDDLATVPHPSYVAKALRLNCPPCAGG
jgi:A/G-specific adenine glycosylase